MRPALYVHGRRPGKTPKVQPMGWHQSVTHVLAPCPPRPATVNMPWSELIMLAPGRSQRRVRAPGLPGQGPFMSGGERKIRLTPSGRGRIIVRTPAKLGGLKVRTACGLTIRETADCQSALLKQTGTSRFVGEINQLLVGWGRRPGTGALRSLGHTQ